MATIEARKGDNGETSYRVKIRIKGHPVQTATFARRTDAKKWAEKIQSEIRDGRHFGNSESKRKTAAEMFARYNREVLSKRKPTQRNQLQQQLNWWNEKLGEYRIADVTPALVSECREKLATGETQYNRNRSGATVNRYLALLSHIFTIAINEWQWAETNPLRKVRKLQEAQGRIRFLSDEERTALLEKCKQSESSGLYAVVVLALSTGMRKSEILGLRWPDIDFARGWITIHHTKNGHRRAVGLAGPALKLLEKRARVRRLDTDLIFPSPDSDKPLDIRSAWEVALRESGIENFRFHDLRHSAASYLAMNGATSAELAEILGHRTLSMVKRYSHISQSHAAKVVERMNKAVFGDG